jgi:hypothetical protein
MQNKKARPLQVGLFASVDNAAGQCHFARGPTLKTAQATGCPSIIAELRAVLQSLTQSFLDCGLPYRTFANAGTSVLPSRENKRCESTGHSE